MNESKYQSESINELVTALAKAQAEITHAQKGVDNAFFKSKYADLPSVMDAARPFLAKNGLSVVQITEVDNNGQITLITQLSHASGQWIRGWYPVKPMKADPQGIGSAITYARRYAYCSMVGVAAAEDDGDGNAASSRTETAASKRKRFSDLKKKIEESDCPEETWHENAAEISAFKIDDETFFDDLVKAGSERKKQLEAMKAANDSMGEGFNSVTVDNSRSDGMFVFKKGA